MSTLPPNVRNTLVRPIADIGGRDMAHLLHTILTNGPNHVNTTYCQCCHTCEQRLFKQEMSPYPVAVVGRRPCPYCSTCPGNGARAPPLQTRRRYMAEAASWVLGKVFQNARRLRDGILREARQTKSEFFQVLMWAANNKCRVSILLALFSIAVVKWTTWALS